jgi:Salmonella virulence plasmid 65kDa B protein
MSEKSAAERTALSLPKGGGAIKGIGETFQANLFSGTANHSVPIALSPGRNGFGPKLSLEYSSGNGNGIFGLGWQITLPRITRKTEKGLPRYDDDDVFVMSGAEESC